MMFAKQINKQKRDKVNLAKRKQLVKLGLEDMRIHPTVLPTSLKAWNFSKKIQNVILDCSGKICYHSGCPWRGKGGMRREVMAKGDFSFSCHIHFFKKQKLEKKWHTHTQTEATFSLLALTPPSLPLCPGLVLQRSVISHGGWDLFALGVLFSPWKVKESISYSVMSNSLQPHRLYPLSL